LADDAVGVGNWSLTSLAYDKFFQKFYYKYWASKQAFSEKFLYYEKLQFFKKFKRRINRSNIRLFRKRRLKKLNILFKRFQIYRADRRNIKLAIFFDTLQNDLTHMKSGVFSYFDNDVGDIDEFGKMQNSLCSKMP